MVIQTKRPIRIKGRIENRSSLNSLFISSNDSFIWLIKMGDLAILFRGAPTTETVLLLSEKFILNTKYFNERQRC